MARTEPNNIEAEINTLGCAFLSKSSLDKVVEELNGDMFYSEKNKAISIAKSLKKSGLDAKFISENTGLSIKEIEKL